MMRPLTIADVRAVIRAHPVVFAGVANAGAVRSEDISLQIFDLIHRNPEVLDSVVGAGMGIDPAAASKLGFMRHVYGLMIAAQTTAALQPFDLFNAIAEELGALLAPGGMALQ